MLGFTLHNPLVTPFKVEGKFHLFVALRMYVWLDLILAVLERSLL